MIRIYVLESCSNALTFRNAVVSILQVLLPDLKCFFPQHQTKNGSEQCSINNIKQKRLAEYLHTFKFKRDTVRLINQVLRLKLYLLINSTTYPGKMKQ